MASIRTNEGWWDTSLPDERNERALVSAYTRLLGIELDLAPQPLDQHVDAAVERLKAPVCERVQQRVPAEDPPWPGDKHSQDRMLAARQLNRLARLAFERAGAPSKATMTNLAGRAHGGRSTFGRKRGLYVIADMRSMGHSGSGADRGIAGGARSRLSARPSPRAPRAASAPLRSPAFPRSANDPSSSIRWNRSYRTGSRDLRGRFPKALRTLETLN